jgi:hypothetical protein
MFVYHEAHEAHEGGFIHLLLKSGRNLTPIKTLRE